MRSDCLRCWSRKRQSVRQQWHSGPACRSAWQMPAREPSSPPIRTRWRRPHYYEPPLSCVPTDLDLSLSGRAPFLLVPSLASPRNKCRPHRNPYPPTQPNQSRLSPDGLLTLDLRVLVPSLLLTSVSVAISALTNAVRCSTWFTV